MTFEEMLQRKMDDGLRQGIQKGIAKGITEGTILELKVTAPDGRELCSNLKLTPEDMELFRELQELSQ